MPLPIALVIFFASFAFAQPVSFGVRGGVPLTGPFADVTESPVQTFSGSNEYTVGPMVELRLPLGFSVEADGLYHPLNLVQQINTGTTVFHNPYKFMSWEFPVLGKYHFLRLPVAKPYVEAGPSFRATSSSVSNYFSKAGLAFGVGIELRLSRLRIEPEFRYTRWRSDATVTSTNSSGTFVVPNFAPSNLNQAQLLVGFTF
jgi:hypothetical protein